MTAGVLLVGGDGRSSSFGVLQEAATLTVLHLGVRDVHTNHCRLGGLYIGLEACMLGGLQAWRLGGLEAWMVSFQKQSLLSSACQPPGPASAWR